MSARKVRHFQRAVNASLLAVMEQQGITRIELARHMGCTPAAVTHFLQPDRNLTLESISKLASACGCEVRVVLEVRDAK